MSPIMARRNPQEAITSMVREGSLHGGLPYLAFGAGPPLVVLPGLSAENGNPAGMARSFQLRPLRPLARQLTVHVVNRGRGLPPGSTIQDLADEVAGRPRRAWAAYAPALAATTAGGHLFAMLMWLFGARMGAGDLSDLVTMIAAEDTFDAGRGSTASPPRRW